MPRRGYQKHRNLIVERDDGRCGIHSEGCLLPLGDTAISIDHIIPESLFYNFPNKEEFHEPWNLQPMHESCNRNKEGQVIDWPEFNCKCHGVYIDENGSRSIMHKENGRWEDMVYYKGKENYSTTPTTPKPSNSFAMLMRKQGKNTGMMIKRPGSFGHLIQPVGFYERLELNVIELERVGRWKKIKEEAGIFLRHCQRDGGISLYWEAGPESQNVINMFRELGKRARSRRRRTKGKYSNQNIARKIISQYRVQGPFLGGFVFHIPDEKEMKIAELENRAQTEDMGIAKEASEELVREYPTYAASWASQGVIKARTKDWEGAERDLTKAIEKEDLAIFRMLRAKVNFLAGNLEKAQEDIENALGMMRAGQDRKTRLMSKQTGQEMSKEEIIAEFEKLKESIEEETQK